MPVLKKKKNMERSNREKRESLKEKNPHTERRRRIAGGRHPKWQRKLNPNSESDSKEERWPIGEETEGTSP